MDQQIMPLFSFFYRNLVERRFYVVLIVLSVVVGLLNILPPVLIGLYVFNSGNDFVLAQQESYRDEFFQYLPRIREVFDGHFPPRNVFSEDSGPTPLNPLPSALFSPFLFLFDGNLNHAYISAQFAFAVVIFLLFFWLGWLMVRSKLWAVFFALVGVLTQIPQLIFRYYDRDFLGITLKKFIPIVRTPIDKMYFARVDDPMLTYPILLAAIISFYFFWVRPRKITALTAGLFGGLLAYTYLHYWLFWAVFLGVMFLYILLSGRMDKIGLRSYLVLIFTVAVVLIPYIMNYFDFSRTSYGSDYSFRLGRESNRLLILDHIGSPSGRAIIFNHLVYLIILAGVYFFYSRKKVNPSKGAIFVCLVITMFLVWYTPLFLGFGFALGHFNKPIGLVVYIILFNLVHDFLKSYGQSKFGQAKPIINTILVTLALLLISKHIVNAFVLKNPPMDLTQRYVFPKNVTSSWGWINAGIEGEPTVVSSSLITSLYLASYTSSRPYLATGFLSLSTNSELEDRFLVSNKLFKISSQTLADRLTERFETDCLVTACFKDSRVNVDKNMWYLLPAVLTKSKLYLEPHSVLKRYENMSPDWLETNSDYVYYGPWERQFGPAELSRSPDLKLVYYNPSVEVYRISK